MNNAEQSGDGVCQPHSSGKDAVQHAIFSEVIAALEEGSLDLPTLPDMVRRFQALVDDHNASTNKVVELLSTDPVVSMYVIRAANSAALSYGAPVGNLSEAVSRLGYSMLRSIVVNIAMTKLFHSRNPLIRLRLVKLWKHSREVAASCYVLAQQQKHLKPEEAMLAGLVHDIGELPLYLYADRYPASLGHTVLDELVCKFADTVGTRLLQNWGFPDELVAVPAGHKDLYRVTQSSLADYVDVVTMANLQVPDSVMSAPWRHIHAAERLGYYSGDCMKFLSNHSGQIVAAKDMLGAGKA